MIRKIALAHALLACSIAYGSSFQFQEIVIPGAVFVFPQSINDAGVVVGYYFTTTESVAFKYQNGVAQRIGFASSGLLQPLDVNNRGDIVGTSNSLGFLLSASTGVLSLYGNPNCLWTAFSGINDAGSIVGQCGNPSIATTAFLFENGRFNDSVEPLALLGPITDINNRNQVVSYFGGGQLGSGAVTLPAGTGINDVGQISTFSGVWTNGVFAPVSIPGQFVTLNKLNNRGQVAGYYYDGTIVHGFIASPVPEPSTAFAGLILIAIAMTSRRKESAKMASYADPRVPVDRVQPHLDRV